jgi:hypothetical protein
MDSELTSRSTTLHDLARYILEIVGRRTTASIPTRHGLFLVVEESFRKTTMYIKWRPSDFALVSLFPPFYSMMEQFLDSVGGP